jgi:hypothetical protein
MIKTLRPQSPYGIIDEPESVLGGRLWRQGSMGFGLSLVAINVCGALGIGMIALVYKIQKRNQLKRNRRLRERLHVEA